MKIFLKKRKAVNVQVLTINLLVLLLIYQPFQSTATHISGADLTYTWVSGNTFELELSLYRDCAGITAPNNVSINYSSVNCGYNLNVTLNRKSGTGQEITQVCNSSTSTCNGGTSPGIQKYEYIGNVTLPAQCSDWIFGYSICCRNCAITTLTFYPLNCSGAPAIYVEATLNNLNAPRNSSPAFSNLPIAFFCIGQPFHYNHGAIDSDGDSIVYSFIPPSSAAGTNVSFTPPYSAINPISSSPPLSLSTTGDMLLNPTAMEVGVMAILVREYRNGILVGSVVRDMQVYTQPCSNVLPTASGVDGTNNYSIVACPEKPLSFTILTADPDISQIVNVDWNYGIPGATLTSNNTNRPTATFNWTPTISDARTQAYTFTLNVIDNNCPSFGSQIYTYSVWVPPLSVSENITNALCAASATGSASATVTGAGPFQYLWTPGNATTSVINGILPGVYSVRVTDQFGCTATASNSINAPASLVGDIVSIVPVRCFGASDGSATIAASGGIAPYTYSWSPYGGNSETAVGLDTGIYIVTIRDANNCTFLLTIPISQPPPLGIIYSANPAGCGLSNGSATVTVSGGTRPLSYLWSTGLINSPQINNIQSGSYQVTVTDANNCVITTSIAVSNTSGPTAQVTVIDNVSCHGGNNGHATVSVSSGTPPFSYLWSSSGSTGSGTSNLSAGNHTVSIADSNNCVTAIPFTIMEPAALISHSTTNPATCYGRNDGSASVLVSGGTVPYAYSWSNGQNSQLIAQIPSGTYTITCTDSNGCITVTDAIVTQPTAIILHTISTPVLCNGGLDGQGIAQCSGGTPGYIYSWSNGSSSNISTGLTAGSYSVHVTDANGCTESNIVNISEPNPLVINSSTHDITCFGASNGIAVINVSGGTSPYTYNWSGTGGTAYSDSSLVAGNYTVIINDIHSCTGQQLIQIRQPSQINPNTQSTDVSCHGGENGTVSVSCTGGTPPYYYAWNDGNSDSTSSQLSAGIYTVQISDQQGCNLSESIIIREPDPVLVSVLNSPIICMGQTAFLSAQGTGGNPPYYYYWGNGIIGQSQTVNPVLTNTYTIQAIDVHGCVSEFDSVQVTVYPSLLALTTGTDSICEGAIAQLSVNPSGGNGGPYTFQWSSGSKQQHQTVQPQNTSTYTVSVQDNCGSPASVATFTVIVNSNPDANFTPDPVSGCVPLKIPFSSNSGNQSLISEEWDFGDGNFSTEEKPVHIYRNPGQYTVSHWVTNSNNCSSEIIIPRTVTAYALPVATFYSSPETGSLLAPTITFENKSTDALKYYWHFGEEGATAIIKDPEYTYNDTGTYTVRLITESVNGCLDTTFGIVRVKGEFALYIPNAFTPNGDGVNEGFAPLAIGAREIKMIILDRWGIEIFHSTDEILSWNGKRAGTDIPCQLDVYVYIITASDLEGNQYRYTGRVNLIR